MTDDSDCHDQRACVSRIRQDRRSFRSFRHSRRVVSRMSFTLFPWCGIGALRVGAQQHADRWAEPRRPHEVLQSTRKYFMPRSHGRARSGFERLTRAALVESLATIALLAFAGTASAAPTFYVDCSGGNDASGPGTGSGAWRSIGRANAARSRPATVVLKALRMDRAAHPASGKAPPSAPSPSAPTAPGRAGDSELLRHRPDLPALPHPRGYRHARRCADPTTRLAAMRRQAGGSASASTRRPPTTRCDTPPPRALQRHPGRTGLAPQQAHSATT